ncbi:hypothetical protein LJB42_000653 [Komagataella kurtzmanii]|nr:hypothetical protein LJB42_000653 [Komagataella kurtzmanii]
MFPISVRRQFSVLSHLRVNARWFYAVDVPISKPEQFKYTQTKPPQKFLPFNDSDNSLLEKSFKDGDKTVLQVLEDRLFNCDIKSRQLYPIYWQGPVYEVRRGIWFSNGTPIDQRLSDLIEKQYQALKDKLGMEEDQTLFELDDKTSELSPIEKSENLTTTITETFGSSESQSPKKLVLFKDEKTVFILPKSSKLLIQLLNPLADELKKSIFSDYKIERGYKAKEKDKSQVNKGSTSAFGDYSFINFFTDTAIDKNAKSDQAEEKMEYHMKNDFAKEDKDTKRDINHIVLCCHGIGQSLGTKLESVNFIHDINIFRKGLATALKEDSELQEISPSASNHGIQVLPVIWRYNLGFSIDEPISVIDENDGVKKLPSVSDITVDALRPLRNLLGNVVLDILLYYDSWYKKRILSSVVQQCNDVYDKFLQNNPGWNGKVSFVGHSLGSAIFFDILCKQPDNLNFEDPNFDHKRYLKFKVENYFALGSPLGVFSLLKRQNIGPRSEENLVSVNDIDKEVLERPCVGPKCENFYNIFHPCDSIGYRVEPLIRSEFTKFKPSPVPFANKSGFDSQLKEITDFGDEFGDKLTNNISKLFGNKSIGELLLLDSKKPETENLSSDSPEESHKKSSSSKSTRVDISAESLKVIKQLNYSGRVDYCLSEGLFDISIINAIKAHTTYFENKDLTAFVLRELLSPKSKEQLVSKSAVLMSSGDDDNEWL